MLQLQTSKGRGYGVVTDTAFKLQERVMSINGKLTLDIQDESIEKYLLQVGYQKDRGLYLAPASYFGTSSEDEIWKYVNHSCQPNMRVNITGSLKKPNAVMFEAVRDIKAGEELTFDYSTTQTEPWQMICFCDAKECRQIIGPLRTLPLLTKLKYFGMGMFPRFTWSYSLLFDGELS